MEVGMKPLVLCIVVVLIGVLSSCSSSNSTSDVILPQLVYQHPLPAYPKELSAAQLRVPLEIHVSKEGTVTDVRLVKSSGTPSWDSAAIAAIMKWRYSPARAENRPVGLWLHQTAIVRFSAPKYIMLAEIICTGREEIDSAYQMLLEGGAFSDAAKRFSVGETHDAGGSIGVVNIQVYPSSIKHHLNGLDVNEFTEPIPFGDRYAIFKRMQE